MSTPHRDKHIIDRLGGPSKVARMLGYPPELGVQRVHNWTVRGIPSAVRLNHLDLFGPPDPAADGGGKNVAADMPCAHGTTASTPTEPAKSPRVEGIRGQTHG